VRSTTSGWTGPGMSCISFAIPDVGRVDWAFVIAATEFSTWARVVSLRSARWNTGRIAAIQQLATFRMTSCVVLMNSDVSDSPAEYLLDNEDSSAFGGGRHPRGPSGCPKSIGPLSGSSGPRAKVIVGVLGRPPRSHGIQISSCNLV